MAAYTHLCMRILLGVTLIFPACVGVKWHRVKSLRDWVPTPWNPHPRSSTGLYKCGTVRNVLHSTYAQDFLLHPLAPAVIHTQQHAPNSLARATQATNRWRCRLSVGGSVWEAAAVQLGSHHARCAHTREQTGVLQVEKQWAASAWHLLPQSHQSHSLKTSNTALRIRIQRHTRLHFPLKSTSGHTCPPTSGAACNPAVHAPTDAGARTLM